MERISQHARCLENDILSAGAYGEPVLTLPPHVSIENLYKKTKKQTKKNKKNTGA